MPKGTKQKQKLYILSQIMLERTDETHYLTLSEIKNLLEKEGVTADRKTLYEDLQELHGDSHHKKSINRLGDYDEKECIDTKKV